MWYLVATHTRKKKKTISLKGGNVSLHGPSNDKIYRSVRALVAVALRFLLLHRFQNLRNGKKGGGGGGRARAGRRGTAAVGGSAIHPAHWCVPLARLWRANLQPSHSARRCLYRSLLCCFGSGLFPMPTLLTLADLAREIHWIPRSIMPGSP